MGDMYREPKMYTEEVHAKRTMEILDKSEPCSMCPGSQDYDPESTPCDSDMWINHEVVCDVCLRFVGLDPSVFEPNGKCPCHRLGKEEAVEAVTTALVKKGYMK